MKPIKSEWAWAGMIAGGLLIYAVNPIAGAVAAGALYTLYKEHKTAEAQEEEREREQFRQAFRARQNYPSYGDYLQSAVWRAKRELVLRRCGGRCEAHLCTESVAEVHHLRYPTIWGEEPVSSLRGLCREHHKEAHGMADRTTAKQ